MTSRGLRLILATGILALSLPAAGWSQADEQDGAHALLDKVKKTDSERQVAAKQMEIDRLKQDQDRAEKDTGTLQATIQSTTEMIENSNGGLTTLLTESKKLQHDLAVTEARIAAERQKIEGLKALGAAQNKSLSAMNLHLEESQNRSKVRSAELEMLQNGQSVPSEGNEEKAQGDLARLRKSLAAAQSKTQSEERLAREAMKQAVAKLAQAETRAAAVKRLSDVDPTAPTPVAEKAVKRKSAERPAQPEMISPAAPRPATVPVKPASPAVKPASPVIKPTPAKSGATPKPANSPSGSLFSR